MRSTHIFHSRLSFISFLLLSTSISLSLFLPLQMRHFGRSKELLCPMIIQFWIFFYMATVFGSRFIFLFLSSSPSLKYMRNSKIDISFHYQKLLVHHFIFVFTCWKVPVGVGVVNQGMKIKTNFLTNWYLYKALKGKKMRASERKR